MASTLITAKVSIEALKMLRLISALTGEKQYEVLERVLKSELESIREAGNGDK